MKRTECGCEGLEGQRVSVALRDGNRIDDGELVSIGRPPVGTMWLYVSGADLFVPLRDVVSCWEAGAHPCS